MAVCPKQETNPGAEPSRTITHLVFYHLNELNPNAADRLTELVALLLSPLARSTEGVLSVQLLKLTPAVRDVSMKGFEYCLKVEFSDALALGRYMSHEDHKTYCRLLFTGWMLSTSLQLTPERRVAEAVECAVLIPLPKERGTLVVDPQVPHRERIWAGEQVVDMQPVSIRLP